MAPSNKTPKQIFYDGGVEEVDPERFDNVNTLKDMLVVMFYNSSDDKFQCTARKFAKASKITEKYNNKFISVNCSDYNDLCQREHIFDTPAIKFYSRSTLVGSIRNAADLTTERIRDIVEEIPNIYGHILAQRKGKVWKKPWEI